MTPELAQAVAAGSTVVTPNRRSALHLKRAFDALQLHAGRTVWPGADILPYHAFLERTWLELAVADGALLLSPQQETALWERVVADSPQADILLSPAATARAVREAWTIRHAYRIDPARYRSILDEDAVAFEAWSRRYAERCAAAGWLDGARLPEAIAARLDGGTRCGVRDIVRYGFDALAPQQQALFEALAAAGCGISDAAPPRHVAQAVRRGAADAEAELTAVAQQVRAALAAGPGQRIGVVVPDLAARRADVMRIFDDVLEPVRVTGITHERTRPFNVSLGLPLTDYPLVHAAFLILHLARGELPLAEAGVLLRSPFLAAAEEEFAARALLDRGLRGRGRSTVRIGALLHGARGKSRGDPAAAPRLAALLEAWLPLARETQKKRGPPSAWSATLLALLKGLGWPGERALNSAEYQTFERLRNAISGLSVLDPVLPPLTCGEALSALRRSVADTLFQPESPEVPVQVLGVLEATGLEFDILFVTGLSDDAWPAAPRPNPFLPVSVQRALGVPHASPEWELQFARRTLQQWLGAARRVVCTYPQREGDRELKASPLIAALPEEDAPGARPALYRDTVFAARRIESLADFAAPLLAPPVHVPGGSQFFKNQAACPFRAYAAHRLGAVALEDGHDGLDARERGSLVHQAAAHLWRTVSTHARLTALSDGELDAILAEAAGAAVDHLRRSRPDAMTEAYAALERARLGALLARLVALEKMRAPFEVLAVERAQSVRVAGIDITARLDRLDRVTGGCVILDYKTGRAQAGDWLGERPEEPQLPLYAVGGGAEVCGVAFVQLRAQEVAFKGLARETGAFSEVEDGTWKGVSGVGNWSALLEDWRVMLERLAREFLGGRADVVPKKYPDTCKHCDLGPLCRVRELRGREPVAVEEENGDD